MRSNTKHYSLSIQMWPFLVIFAPGHQFAVGVLGSSYRKLKSCISTVVLNISVSILNSFVTSSLLKSALVPCLCQCPDTLSSFSQNCIGNSLSAGF